ncbi:hypothetical protein GCM10028778_24010 [Barrientosiimonas marina]|uniref:DUF1850 domain-containing protein n=1 Tax=Lentibacillus kimchii TaxID=1542911 RepID=A0ABW2UZ21_9BACI
MYESARKRHSLRGRRLAGLLFGIFLLIGGFVLLSSVHVMLGEADNGDVLLAQRVNTDTQWSSRYIHSVEKCPIIEKYEIDDQYKMVLMESWNCSFGAGIATQSPPGATDRLEDGYYVIDDIDKPFDDVLFHPVSIAEQELTIDGETWQISRQPFEGRTFSLKIEKETRMTYLWQRLFAAGQEGESYG